MLVTLKTQGLQRRIKLGFWEIVHLPLPLANIEAGGGGRWFKPGRTNTQGLQITEEKVLPL